MNKSNRFTQLFIFRAGQLNNKRLRNPLLFSDTAFSTYLKLTGQQKVFDTVYKLPNQVSQLQIKLVFIYFYIY